MKATDLGGPTGAKLPSAVGRSVTPTYSTQRWARLTFTGSWVEYALMAVISLTTDFGDVDGYVGVIKGVMLSIAPRARLVDLSHQIPPHDVRRAAFLLYTAAPFFPPDTIHLAVVDPGVGTARRSIALQTECGIFVGPDNGLFSYVLAEATAWAAVALTEPRFRLPDVSDTFHGRDLFAPAAAHLASGTPLEALGPAVSDPVALPLPTLQVGRERLEGEVLYVDRFGNLVTSIGRLRWKDEYLILTLAFRPPGPPAPPVRAADVRLALGGRSVRGIRRTYGEMGEGELLALVGSAGFLEVACCRGSAAEVMGIGAGEPVRMDL